MVFPNIKGALDFVVRYYIEDIAKLGYLSHASYRFGENPQIELNVKHPEGLEVQAEHQEIISNFVASEAVYEGHTHKVQVVYKGSSNIQAD